GQIGLKLGLIQDLLRRARPIHEIDEINRRETHRSRSRPAFGRQPDLAVLADQLELEPRVKGLCYSGKGCPGYFDRYRSSHRVIRTRWLSLILELEQRLRKNLRGIWAPRSRPPINF